MRAIWNTAQLALVTSVATIVLAVLVSWFVVRRRRGDNGVANYLATVSFLPQCVPSIVIGLAFIFVYVRFPIPIYGTLWIIALAMTTRYLAYSSRATTSALMQVHGELEEASQMAGAAWTRTIRRITVPLLAPALINVFFWVAVHAMQELSMALMLYNPDTVVVSTMIWSMWQNGRTADAAVLGVLLTCYRRCCCWAATWFRACGCGRIHNLIRRSVIAAIVLLSWTWARVESARARRNMIPLILGSIVISVKDLVKTFPGAKGEVRALNGVSFEVGKGELFTLARPERLRQNDDAALHRRARTTGGRRDRDQRPRRVSRRRRHLSAAGATPDRHGVSILRHLAAYDGVSKRRLSAGERQRPRRRQPASRRCTRSAEPGTFGGPARAQFERRAAAARGTGARVGRATPGAAARRAAQQSRRQAARADALRVEVAARVVWHHHRVRDPRSGRSAGAVGSHRFDA